LTRAQLAAIWCRSLKVRDNNPPYKDISPLKNYYDSPAIVLYSLGIMNGTSASSFSPNEYVTRSQLVILAMRAYNLGVSERDAYQMYSDYGTIPDWARDAVSACINANVLDDLYDRGSFSPNKYVTRAEACKMIYNVQLPIHTIFVAPLTGGTITANPTKAREGTTIALNVLPDEGQRLKAGSLKYDDTVITGTSFPMPPKDILINAEFEYKPVIAESITILNPPVKRIYTVGETLDLMGLVVYVNYSNGVSIPAQSFSTVPEFGTVFNTTGTIAVEVYYYEGNVAKTATFTVLVKAIA
jgi:hypothetical protein